MHSCNYFASCSPFIIFLCAHFYSYRPDHGGREPVLQLPATAEGWGGGGRAGKSYRSRHGLSFSSNLQLLQCSCRKWDSCDKTLRALQLKDSTLCYSDILLEYGLSCFGGVCEVTQKSAFLGKAVNTRFKHRCLSWRCNITVVYFKLGIWDASKVARIN